MKKKTITKWGVGLLFLISLFIISVLINPGTEPPDFIDYVIAGFHLPGLFITYYWTYWTLNRSRTIKWIQLISIFGFTPGLLLNHLLLNVIDFSEIIGFYFVSPFTYFGQFVLLIPFILIGFVHFGLDTYNQTKELEEALKESKLKEQSYKESLLKTQIQPHFLFNALNTLYALARKKDEQSPAAVLELSDLLRYTVDSNTKEWVNLESEVSFLNAYCGFQKKRLSKDVQIDIAIQIEDVELQIPPLLFQPLIENAFKYVDGEQQKSLAIKLNQSAKTLSIEVINTCIPKEELKFGQGIKLVENRLENTYGFRAKMTYGYEGQNFKVNVKIELS